MILRKILSENTRIYSTILKKKYAVGHDNSNTVQQVMKVIIKWVITTKLGLENQIKER